MRVREPEVAAARRRFRAVGNCRQAGDLGECWFRRAAFFRRKNGSSRIRHSKPR
jgi:hypothetical protein